MSRSSFAAGLVVCVVGLQAACGRDQPADEVPDGQVIVAPVPLPIAVDTLGAGAADPAPGAAADTPTVR
jgi:hypothetical protein